MYATSRLWYEDGWPGRSGSHCSGPSSATRCLSPGLTFTQRNQEGLDQRRAMKERGLELRSILKECSAGPGYLLPSDGDNSGFLVAQLGDRSRGASWKKGLVARARVESRPERMSGVKGTVQPTQRTPLKNCAPHRKPPHQCQRWATDQLKGNTLSLLKTEIPAGKNLE